MRIGINGFGRIGRAILRINLEKNYFDIVHINDINPDINNLAYLIKFDSTYGKLTNKVKVEKNKLIIDGNEIVVTHENSISDVDWRSSSVDILIDSSGVDMNLNNASKLKSQGIMQYICTNSPAKEKVDKTIIMGVNEETIDLDNDFKIAASICDANAFVPVTNLLENNYGIEHGFLTTLHPWLGYQNLLDGPSVSYSSPGEIHDDYTLGRSSFGTLIPKTTSTIIASCKVLESLNGKFLSFSYRVPTMIVGSGDASIKLKKKTSTGEVRELFNQAQRDQKYKIYYNNSKNLISSDFIRSEYSVIVDQRWLHVNHDNYIKVVMWYDNEWGYSARIIDLVNFISEQYQK
jgi:glyceraldehyde 3-phosphate dehydrogenase